MESLTKQIADAAWRIIEDIDAMGGMIRAIESGWANQQIEESAAAKQAKIDSGEAVIVGVSKYRLDHEAEHETLRVDTTKVRESQLQLLSGIKAARNSDAVREALEALTRCGYDGKGNLLKLSISAMKARATVGEVSEALEKCFGRYTAEAHLVSGVYATNYGDQGHWI